MRSALIAVLGVSLLLGCSDPSAPAPGSFRAQLGGARTGGLSGESSGSPFFSVEFPEARYAVRMFDVDGDQLRALVLHCPGELPPATGSYAVSTAFSDCGGTYSRVQTSQSGETVVLEQATASSGRLTIDGNTGGELTGSFSFEGTLLIGTQPAGTLRASGAFSSTAGP